MTSYVIRYSLYCINLMLLRGVISNQRYSVRSIQSAAMWVFSADQLLISFFGKNDSISG